MVHFLLIGALVAAIGWVLVSYSHFDGIKKAGGHPVWDWWQPHHGFITYPVTQATSNAAPYSVMQPAVPSNSPTGPNGQVIY